jgi:hypothetical protein
MTTADLGKQFRALHHPNYSDVSDHNLGLALKSKYPGFYDHIPDSESENPKQGGNSRLLSKFSDLQSGMRRVVFVPRGTKDNPNAADYGMKRLTLPSGSYFYDPQVIRPQEIMAAIRDHNTEDLLAPVAVEEEEAPPEPMPQGAELQDAIDSAGDAGGPKAVEIPKVDIQDKVAAATRRRGDRWPKPGGPVKLPIGG